MHPDTRRALNAYYTQLQQLNGIASVHEKFAVAPGVQQKLETKIQESSAFLSRINIIGVREMWGDKLGLGVNGPIASRTNTEAAERATRDVHTLDERRYTCVQTNYDTHLRYATIDAWAKFPDFQARVRDVIVKRQALDRMLIGFNGKSAAADTDLAANPLLQDVNTGWLQHIETDAPARVLDSGATEGQIAVGEGGDFKNLDSMVYDSIQLLDPWYREQPGLVAIMGRALLHDKYFPLVDNNGDKPTEQLAADIIISQKRMGGLQAITVPYFPENALLITPLANLSIYYQDSARRRAIIDNPKRDRIENYESSNDAYVVEKYGACALVKNITLV
ncbi:MAG: phage major capsid protein, P2 family [Desulfovibrionaceae bacterium]|nr:phage major capsid protein, P2 family [Desulfovibrionaceae bacterium]